MLEDVTCDMARFWCLLELVDKVYQEDLLYQSSKAGKSPADPLLQDPTAWQLMMDWAEDKIGYGELDTMMCGYRSQYIHEEWKSLINKIFVHSDPGVDHMITPSFLVQQAMKAQEVVFSSMASPSLPGVAASCSTLSQGSTHRQCTTRKAKCCKLDTNWFVNIAAIKEEEEGGEEDKIEGSLCRPEVVQPSGKRSYQNKINTIIKRFSRWEEV